MGQILHAVPILANFLGKIYRQRHLIFSFVRRDLRTRYVGSFMGLFWSVLQPAVLLASYVFVFSGVFKVSISRTESAAPFPLFLFCGILPWLFFQETLGRSATVLLEHSQILKKTLFPAEILPISVMVSTLVNHAIGFSLLVLVVAWEGLLSWTVVLTPLYLLLLMVLALGLGWIVAALNVFLRDTAQIVAVLLTFWFWFTPIFYTPAMAPGWIVPWMKLNPLSYVVEAYRQLLLEGRVPARDTFLPLLASATLIFLVGGFFFRNVKRDFVDVL